MFKLNVMFCAVSITTLLTFGMQSHTAYALPTVEIQALNSHAPVFEQPDTPSVSTSTTTDKTRDNTTPPMTADQSAKLWEMYQQVQALQQEIKQLNGRVQDQESLLEKTRTDAKMRYNDIDQRLIQRDEMVKEEVTTRFIDQPATTEQTISADTPKTDTFTSTQVIEPSTTSTHSAILTNQTNQATSTNQSTTVASVTPQNTTEPVEFSYPNDEDKRAYVSAYDAYREGGAIKAIAPMKSFIANYPKSTHFANANYWLGEFYLAITPPNYTEAKRAFNTVMTRFPDSAKSASSMYRLATMAEVENKVVESNRLMTRIIKEYPTSKEAGYAISFLGYNPLLPRSNTNKVPTNEKSTPTTSPKKTKEPTTTTPTINRAKA